MYIQKIVSWAFTTLAKELNRGWEQGVKTFNFTSTTTSNEFLNKLFHFPLLFNLSRYRNCDICVPLSSTETPTGYQIHIKKQIQPIMLTFTSIWTFSICTICTNWTQILAFDTFVYIDTFFFFFVINVFFFSVPLHASYTVGRLVGFAGFTWLMTHWTRKENWIINIQFNYPSSEKTFKKKIRLLTRTHCIGIIGKCVVISFCTFVTKFSRVPIITNAFSRSFSVTRALQYDYK